MWIYLPNLSLLEILSTLAYILFLIQDSCAVTCPRDLFSSVFACFRYLNGPNQKDLVVAGADLYAVKKRCEDGSFNKAVKCVENLDRVCAYSPKRDLLHKLTNTALMDRGFKIFCDNIFLYGENKRCLEEENRIIQRCISYHQDVFDYQMSKTPEDDDAMLNTVCGFLTGMTGCIDRPVRSSCDTALADILLHFMSGITPPVCEPYSSKGSHSPLSAIHNSCHWILISSSASFVIFMVVFYDRFRLT